MACNIRLPAFNTRPQLHAAPSSSVTIAQPLARRGTCNGRHASATVQAAGTRAVDTAQGPQANAASAPARRGQPRKQQAQKQAPNVDWDMRMSGAVGKMVGNMVEGSAGQEVPTLQAPNTPAPVHALIKALAGVNRRRLSPRKQKSSGKFLMALPSIETESDGPTLSLDLTLFDALATNPNPAPNPDPDAPSPSDGLPASSPALKINPRSSAAFVTALLLAKANPEEHRGQPPPILATLEAQGQEAVHTMMNAICLTRQKLQQKHGLDCAVLFEPPSRSRRSAASTTPASTPTSASASPSTPTSTPSSAPTPTSASTPSPTPTSTSASTPTSAPTSASAPASTSASASASASAPVPSPEPVVRVHLVLRSLETIVLEVSEFVELHLQGQQQQQQQPYVFWGGRRHRAPAQFGSATLAGVLKDLLQLRPRVTMRVCHAGELAFAMKALALASKGRERGGQEGTYVAFLPELPEPGQAAGGGAEGKEGGQALGQDRGQGKGTEQSKGQSQGQGGAQAQERGQGGASTQQQGKGQGQGGAAKQEQGKVQGQGRAARQDEGQDFFPLDLKVEHLAATPLTVSFMGWPKGFLARHSDREGLKKGLASQLAYTGYWSCLLESPALAVPFLRLAQQTQRALLYRGTRLAIAPEVFVINAPAAPGVSLGASPGTSPGASPGSSAGAEPAAPQQAGGADQEQEPGQQQPEQQPPQQPGQQQQQPQQSRLQQQLLVHCLEYEPLAGDVLQVQPPWTEVKLKGWQQLDALNKLVTLRNQRMCRDPEGEAAGQLTLRPYVGGRNIVRLSLELHQLAPFSEPASHDLPAGAEDMAQQQQQQQQQRNAAGASTSGEGPPGGDTATRGSESEASSAPSDARSAAGRTGPATSASGQPKVLLVSRTSDASMVARAIFWEVLVKAPTGRAAGPDGSSRGPAVVLRMGPGEASVHAASAVALAQGLLAEEGLRVVALPRHILLTEEANPTEAADQKEGADRKFSVVEWGLVPMGLQSGAGALQRAEQGAEDEGEARLVDTAEKAESAA